MVSGQCLSYSEAEISGDGVPRYLVATPYYGAADMQHLNCYASLRQLYPELQGCGYRVMGCAYIDIARAVAAQQALEKGFAGLFFIDHDIIFDPREVVGMIRAAEQHQTAVYGLYGMRASGKRMIGALDDSLAEVTCFVGGGLYPGKDGGLGFAAIPRAVLEAVGREMPLLETGFAKVKPLFALRAGVPDCGELWEKLVNRGMFEPGDQRSRALLFEAAREMSGDWYSGEDISFWHRVRRAGFKVLCDTRPRLGHKGSYVYGLEDVQIVVPRAESLKIELVHITDPDDPAQQQKLHAAAARQFEGLEGLAPRVVPKPQAAE